MQLLTIGKLISTTDMKLARRLNQIVDVNDILGESVPRWFRQTDGVLEFAFRGEFYELAEA